jgi:hypothetical protein
MDPIRIVIGNGAIAKYPQGGGLWAWMLQYILGLNALGHDVYWFVLLRSSGDKVRDQELARTFLQRCVRYGVREQAALLYQVRGAATEMEFESMEALGMEKARVKEICQSADLLWNFFCSLRRPFLLRFRRRVLVGTDPGIIHVSAAQGCDLGIQDHHVFISDGLKLHAPDCQVPTLGFIWHPFPPAIYMPLWEGAPETDPHAPFTSVTQWWNSGELRHEGRVLSISKRDGYLPYLDTPCRTGLPFELAADLAPDTEDGRAERALLEQHGWRIVDPLSRVGSVGAYKRYIWASRAEFACVKPVYRELRTGWFSDRSVAYLSSGRPVIIEDTGFSDVLPVGEGILSFTTLDEAVAAVQDVDARYRRHAHAARSIAREYFDSDKVLRRMIDASMAGGQDRKSSWQPGAVKSLGSEAPDSDSS